MDVEPITDPYPVWGEIRTYLVDDNNELAITGDFLGVFNNGDMAGAFLVKKLNEHCYDIHGGVHPDFWGQGAKICDALGRTIFANSPCLKIVAIIPEFNRLMRKCVTSIGMKQEGIITKSFLKWSRLHDQYVYGICKSEVDTWHQQQ